MIKATKRPCAHPGQVLNTILSEEGISQSALARRLMTRQAKISEIINGKRGIAPEMACRLERALGIKAETWLDMQLKWQLSQVDLSKIPKIKSFDLKKAA